MHQQDEDGGPVRMRRVISEAEISVGGSRQSAREYRIRKSSLIG